MLGYSSELVETFTGLRSQGGVPVTQDRNSQKNVQASSFSQGTFVVSLIFDMPKD